MFEYRLTHHTVVSRYRVDIDTYEVIAKDFDEAKKLVKKNNCWLGKWGHWRKRAGFFQIHRLDRDDEFISLYTNGRCLTG